MAVSDWSELTPGFTADVFKVFFYYNIEGVHAEVWIFLFVFVFSGQKKGPEYFPDKPQR